MTDDLRRKLVPLVTLQKELTEKLQAVTTEIDTLLGGGVGMGQKLKDCEAAFDQAWCERYAPGQRGRYVWAYQRDRPQMKRLITMLGVDELKIRMANYLVNDEAFYMRARHSFGAFVSSVNAHAKAAPVNGSVQAFELDEAPADCRHTPRCRTDVEHTQKTKQDVRRAS